MKFDPWHVVWLILLMIAGALCAVGYLGSNWVLPCTDCDSGTYATFAQTSKDNRACGPLYYTNEAFDGAKIYPSFADIPGDWWKSATVLAGVGIGLLGIGIIAAFVTMFAHSYQPIAHNIEVAGGILILVGLICFAVGLKDTKIDAANVGNGICKICGEKTSPFVLENCTIGDDFILIIVGVVIQCIAGCVGWNVNHRESSNEPARAPPARRWTRKTSPPATNNAAYAPAVPDRNVNV
eukprot:m.25498 g.25498  ORF g.25498 m.25498 type:complete len:238 (-) comp15024_c0_seq1:35-748(-)